MSQVVCLNEPRQPRYQSPELGLKNTCGSSFPTDPIFFCQRYYFFDAAKRAALFSVGSCGLLIQYSVPK